jgi:hypothetical protein
MVCGLGKDRNCKLKPLGIKWPDEPLKLLGVYMSYDQESCNILNYDKKIVKCKNMLNWWKSRNLTMLGRIQIVKTFIVSQFLYVSNVLHMPDKYIKEINVLIRKFVWKGNKSKLKHGIMCKDRSRGGLKVPDFNTMLNVSYVKWMRRLITNKEGMCWNILSWYVQVGNNENMDIFLEANFDLKLLPNASRIPEFYKKVLTVWYEHVQTATSKEVMVWYNKNILNDKKLVYYNDFHRIGIKYINDLFDDNGKPLQFSWLVNKGIDRGKWFQWSALINSVKRHTVYAHTDASGSEQAGKYFIGNMCLFKMKAKQMYNHLLTK